MIGRLGVWSRREDLERLREPSLSAILLDTATSGKKNYLAVPMAERINYPTLVHVGTNYPDEAGTRWIGHQLTFLGKPMTEKARATSVSLDGEDRRRANSLMATLGVTGNTALYRRLCIDRELVESKCYFPGRLRLIGSPSSVLCMRVGEVWFAIGKLTQREPTKEFQLDTVALEGLGMSEDAQKLIEKDVRIILGIDL